MSELDGMGKSYSMLAVSQADRLQENADGMIKTFTSKVIQFWMVLKPLGYTGG